VSVDGVFNNKREPTFFSEKSERQNEAMFNLIIKEREK